VFAQRHRWGNQAGRIWNAYDANRSFGPKYSILDAESAPKSEPVSTLRIPAGYWSVSPYPEAAPAAGETPQPAQLILRGAVLVRILGHRKAAPTDIAGELKLEKPKAILSPDLEAALKEPPYQPEREVWKALRQDGLLNPSILVLALFLSTLTLLIEAVLLQGMLQIGSSSFQCQTLLGIFDPAGFHSDPFSWSFDQLHGATHGTPPGNAPADHLSEKIPALRPLF
jgi:hypothetical protein